MKLFGPSLEDAIEKKCPDMTAEQRKEIATKYEDFIAKTNATTKKISSFTPMVELDPHRVHPQYLAATIENFKNEQKEKEKNLGSKTIGPKIIGPITKEENDILNSMLIDLKRDETPKDGCYTRPSC